MKIGIIGTGAMGSLFGAMLSSVSEVCLIGDFEDHVRAIHQNGLLIEKADGSSKKYHFFVSSNPSEVQIKFDLIIIFTKSYETEKAARIAAPFLAENGLALTLQNGLGNLEIIAAVMGKDRAVAGVTSHGATLMGPGHILHAGQGPTHIAASEKNEPFLKQAAEIFRNAGIDTRLSRDIESLVWGKLIVNVGINALAAILRTPNGTLGITPECEKIMSHAVSEAVAVCNAMKITLPYDNPLQQVKTVCQNTAGNKASMLQDILRGVHTEIGVINRSIVRIGEAFEIPCPYNRFLSELVEALEATAEQRCQ